jgi:peptidoglycan/xylan/chitin deacetylase (PgdA/CDA1 family)
MLERSLPWTLFLTTGFCDRTLPCWWYGLADLLDTNRPLDTTLIGGGMYNLGALSHNQRDYIYNHLRNIIHANWSSANFRSDVEKCFSTHGVNLADVTDRLAMSWDDVNRLHTIGCEIAAHTDQHLNLRVSERFAALEEMRLSKRKISERLRSEVISFAYPYGDSAACGSREFDLAREAGFQLSFTTKNAWLPHRIENHLQQLPRINVSGSWESLDKVLFRLNGWSQIREWGFFRSDFH